VKILFVEDNRDLATNLFDYFESRGHDIDLAYDGISGFKMAATNNYDAVVLDWMLPQLDGVTICKKLRKEGNNTPILMLTARDSAEDKITGLSAGVNDYMIKPFSMRDVESRLLMLALHI
jgi:DNA-binding response OmpR family regulator